MSDSSCSWLHWLASWLGVECSICRSQGQQATSKEDLPPQAYAVLRCLPSMATGSRSASPTTMPAALPTVSRCRATTLMRAPPSLRAYQVGRAAPGLCSVLLVLTLGLVCHLCLVLGAGDQLSFPPLPVGGTVPPSWVFSVHQCGARGTCNCHLMPQYPVCTSAVQEAHVTVTVCQ